MFRDSRGGHNRRNVNENFFKTWSPQMAYILGLIFSDGAIEDVRKSSRTCYTTITSKDADLLPQVKKAMSSEHEIYIKRPAWNEFRGGMRYFCKKAYCLRIGNKVMFQDLVNLGITPRKSLRLKFPNVPNKLFPYFVRGYLDGDGCINTSLQKGRKIPTLVVIFISGSPNFLKKLSEKLSFLLSIKIATVNRRQDLASDLRYKKADSLKILSFVYKNLQSAPYLHRKYEKYKEAIKSLAMPGARISLSPL